MRPEIDFFRGGMLMLMVIYHNFRVLGSNDPIQMALMSWLELGSTPFLVISGVNVANFIASAARNPDFDPLRFYLKASFWLFFMGYGYNLLVGTPHLMDIIQCVALGTLLAYLLLHFKVSNPLVGLVTAALFTAGAIGFSNAVVLSPSVKSHFLFNQILANGTVAEDAVHALFPTSWLFNLFGPIPWAGYFTLGVFLDRLRGKWVWIIGAAAVALGVLGAFVPPLAADNAMLFSFRANPRYILQSVSLSSVWFLLFKAYYRDKTHCNRVIAFWSKTSLLVFVFHWIYIMAASTIIIVMARATGSIIFLAGFRYTRVVLVFTAMALTLRPLENWRLRLAKDPQFIGRMRTMLIIGFVLAVVGVGGVRAPLLLVAGFGGKIMAACAFALSYPSFRAKWRKETVKQGKKVLKKNTVA